MSPYDRALKRLQAVERDLTAGKITAEQAEAKRAAIRSADPAFVARWELADGTEATATFRTMREAEKHEAKMRDKVERGESADPKPLRASIVEIMQYHFDKRCGKGAGVRSARAHVNHCREIMGEGVTFERLNKSPLKILEPYFDKLPEAKPKSFASEANIWNHYVQMKAAMAFWIKMHRLVIANPLQVMEIEKPDNRRTQAPTSEQFSRLLDVSTRNQFPSWLPSLLICGWEVAPRISEILSWRWENFHEAEGLDLPWVKSFLAKKGKPVWRELPITHSAAQALRDMPAQQKERGVIFPLQVTATLRWVRQAFDLAGMQDFRFHDFRRSWKRRYLHIGSKLTAELTGHTEEMDDRYTVLGRREMQEVYRVGKSGENLSSKTA